MFNMTPLNLTGYSRLLASLLCVCLLGCGKSHPPVAKVMGTVTYEGKPAIGGRVLFLPDGGGKQGLGSIQPDGTFELGTFSTNDGALVGKHHAMVVRSAFDSLGDDLLTFRRAEQQRIVVEPDKVNEFTIDLGSREWQKLAD